jgi:hypothetical protein
MPQRLAQPIFEVPEVGRARLVVTLLGDLVAIHSVLRRPIE